MPITVQASQGEVIENRWSAMLARNDVVDVKRQRVNRSRYMTVFATALGPFPDLADEVLIHERECGFGRSARRALDCMTASKFPTCK